MYLGIDAGGTHTDAVLMQDGALYACAKVATCHENLLQSVREVLAQLPTDALRQVRRVTLGTTLAVNAIVQGKTRPVGLVLSAGPGLHAARFAMGPYVHVVEGGLDHRGEEVTPLKPDSLSRIAREWQEQGVDAFAVVGKFSPRNPDHEKRMAEALCASLASVRPRGAGGTRGTDEAKNESPPVVVQGHQLSGQLNFPRRIATAYYNAAVWRLNNDFLDAVEEALAQAQVHAPVFLLKADGGAIPLSLSRQQPVQSILSGPAASVMGVMAALDHEGKGQDAGGEPQDALLLDIGGTTTDIALFGQGFPVLDRDGMQVQAPEHALQGARSTLVRALAFSSIGIGGDGVLGVQQGRVTVGPQRLGSALAFGGTAPTLMDALIVAGYSQCGNPQAAHEGLSAWAKAQQRDPEQVAQEAIDTALKAMRRATEALLERVNAHPVYTLAALLEGKRVQPQRIWLVGGPAEALRPLVESTFGLPVCVPRHAEVANAVGAALTLPTAALELFVDTGRGLARVPALDLQMSVPRGFSLCEATDMAQKLLYEHVARHTGQVGAIEVTEAQLFATLDARGVGARDMRVACQLVPGIVKIGKDGDYPDFSA